MKKTRYIGYDCAKTKHNIQFFKKLKVKLEVMFEQESILIYYVNIYRF